MVLANDCEPVHEVANKPQKARPVPRSAPTPCRHPGCPAVLAAPGYCDRHRVAAHRDYGRARRGFDAERSFYQSAAWRALRAAFLREHPVCCRCEARGVIVAAIVADHVLPIKDGGARLDGANLQALCVPCHNSKTASETALRSRRRTKARAGA